MFFTHKIAVVSPVLPFWLEMKSATQCSVRPIRRSLLRPRLASAASSSFSSPDMVAGLLVGTVCTLTQPLQTLFTHLADFAWVRVGFRPNYSSNFIQKILMILSWNGRRPVYTLGRFQADFYPWWNINLQLSCSIQLDKFARGLIFCAACLHSCFWWVENLTRLLELNEFASLHRNKCMKMRFLLYCQL